MWAQGVRVQGPCGEGTCVRGVTPFFLAGADGCQFVHAASWL